MSEPRVLLYESIQTFSLYAAQQAHFNVQGLTVEHAVDAVRKAIGRNAAIAVDTYPDPFLKDTVRVQARTPDWRSAVEVATAAIEAACRSIAAYNEPDDIEDARRRLAETAADMRHLLDKFRPPVVERATP